MTFEQMGLIEPLLRALSHEGYTTPTAIQSETFHHMIAGRDMLGCAQTGTGKTAAFALPVLQRLHEGAPQSTPTPHAPGKGKAGRGSNRVIRTLVLSPTRELAAQIGDSFKAYGRHLNLRGTTIFGGVNQRPQCQALRQGVDIVVATPGRLMDLLNQRMLTLNSVEILILDEADRMLDMGFINDIRKIIALLPRQRQTLMFSATMPKSIQSLANSILTDPAVVRIETKTATADTIKQSAYFIDPRSKADLLTKLLEDKVMTRTLVFSRTKRGADKITKRLNDRGFSADAIHSNKSQNARTKALHNFKSGRVNVLVASDIAARGLDVDDISHVVNFDMPGDAETYVHRIGRSGRAGTAGQAITFCSHAERSDLRQIEKIIGKQISVLKHTIPALPPHTPHTPSSASQRHPKPSGAGKRNKWKPAGVKRKGQANTSDGHTNNAASHSNNGAPRASSKRRRNRAGKPSSPGKHTGGSGAR
jgi:ATP-dependent RNA helicase RhlE